MLPSLCPIYLTSVPPSLSPFGLSLRLFLYLSVIPFLTLSYVCPSLSLVQYFSPPLLFPLFHPPSIPYASQSLSRHLPLCLPPSLPPSNVTPAGCRRGRWCLGWDKRLLITKYVALVSPLPVHFFWRSPRHYFIFSSLISFPLAVVLVLCRVALRFFCSFAFLSSHYCPFSFTSSILSSYRAPVLYVVSSNFLLPLLFSFASLCFHYFLRRFIPSLFSLLYLRVTFSFFLLRFSFSSSLCFIRSSCYSSLFFSFLYGLQLWV